MRIESTHDDESSHNHESGWSLEEKEWLAHAWSVATRGIHNLQTRSDQLKCRESDDLQKALVATGFGYTTSRRKKQGAIVASLLGHVRDIRRSGSAALDLCLVAGGQVDAYFEHGLNVWDYCAGALIAEEAGAEVKLPPFGTPGSQGALVMAGNKTLIPAFIECLAQAEGTEPIGQ